MRGGTQEASLVSGRQVSRHCGVFYSRTSSSRAHAAINTEAYMRSVTAWSMGIARRRAARHPTALPEPVSRPGKQSWLYAPHEPCEKPRSLGDLDGIGEFRRVRLPHLASSWPSRHFVHPRCESSKLIVASPRTILHATLMSI